MLYHLSSFCLDFIPSTPISRFKFELLLRCIHKIDLSYCDRLLFDLFCKMSPRAWGRGSFFIFWWVYLNMGQGRDQTWFLVIISCCLVMIKIFPHIWIMDKISLHCLKWLHIHLSSKRKVYPALRRHILIVMVIFICRCERTKWIWILSFFKYFLLFFFKRFLEKLHCSIDRFKVDFFAFWLFPFGAFVLNLLNSRRYYGRTRTLTRPLPLLYTAFLPSKLLWRLRRLWFPLPARTLHKSLVLGHHKRHLLDREVKFERILRLLLLVHNRHFLRLSRLFHLN